MSEDSPRPAGGESLADAVGRARQAVDTERQRQLADTQAQEAQARRRMRLIQGATVLLVLLSIGAWVYAGGFVVATYVDPGGVAIAVPDEAAARAALAEVVEAQRRFRAGGYRGGLYGTLA